MRRGSRLNRILDYYAGIPALKLAAVLPQAHGQRVPRAPSAVSEGEHVGRRIGVLANPAIGDTLLLSGPLQDLRAAFPGQELILFACSWTVDAARLLPALDRIELLTLTRPLQTIACLREARLDLLLDCTAWQRLTAFYTLHSGAGFTVGFRTAGQHRHRGYNRSVEHRADRHELDNLRALVACLGVRTGARPRLLVSPVSEPMVEPGLEAVVFHPWASGSNHRLREWPETRWVELAHALASPDTMFVITGSPADELRAEALCRKLARERLPARTCIGHKGLEAIARLLGQARLLVSVNTGIMHLGAILGTPTVSLNGPTAQRRWGPVGPRAVGVNAPDGRGGFLNLGFEFAGRPTDSMEKIGCEQVLAAIATLAPAATAAD